MDDRAIAALFMATVLPLVQAVSGLSAVKMARNYQGERHGADSTPYIYFFKVSEHRHGSPLRRDIYDEQDEEFVHTETQALESTWQFTAWIPPSVTGLTESDILGRVCDIMQSDAIIASFHAAGVGILRVTDERNPYIVDDHDQFSATPSFDITLTHKRTRTTTTPAAVAREVQLRRV